MRIPTVKKVRARMRALARTINSLTRRQLRKGRAVSFGVFNSEIPPNEDKQRLPLPFSGGN